MLCAAPESGNENCVLCTALSSLIFYTRYTLAADKLRIVRLDLSNLCTAFDTEMGIEFQRNLYVSAPYKRNEKKRIAMRASVYVPLDSIFEFSERTAAGYDNNIPSNSPK